MINILIAFDDWDNNLGDFFRGCYYDIYNYVRNNKFFKIIEIDGEHLDKKTIEKTITGFKQSSFLCLAYSHGADNVLVCKESSEEYINQSNSYFFGNSFFYTFSCDTGKKLGGLLLQNGCKTFIGYEDKVTSLNAYEVYFIECANYGIKQFFRGKTVLEVYNSMLDKYENVMDSISDHHPDKLVINAWLGRNKNALMPPLGDENLTIKDFISKK